MSSKIFSLYWDSEPAEISAMWCPLFLQLESCASDTVSVWQRFADLTGSFAAWHLVSECDRMGLLSLERGDYPARSHFVSGSIRMVVKSSLCCLRKPGTCRRCRKCIVQFAYDSMAAVEPSTTNRPRRRWLSLWIISYMRTSSRLPVIPSHRAHSHGQ